MLAVAAVPTWMEQEPCCECRQTRVTGSVWRHTDTLTAHYPRHSKEPRWVIMTVKETSLQAEALVSLSVWFLAQRQVIGVFFPKWFLVQCVTQFFSSVRLISASTSCCSVWRWSSGVSCIDVCHQSHGRKNDVEEVLFGIIGIKILVWTITPKLRCFLFLHNDKHWLNLRHATEPRCKHQLKLDCSGKTST